VSKYEINGKYRQQVLLLMVGKITQFRDTLKTAQKEKRRFYTAADVKDPLPMAHMLTTSTLSIAMTGISITRYFWQAPSYAAVVVVALFSSLRYSRQRGTVSSTIVQ
jgi:multisubunit Na+/H+ antiporter MnhC subunit